MKYFLKKFSNETEKAEILRTIIKAVNDFQKIAYDYLIQDAVIIVGRSNFFSLPDYTINL